jgi:hypothetical protein
MGKLHGWRPLAVSVVVLGAGAFAASFLLGRELSDDGPARAQLPAPTEIPAESTALPGSTPDTTKPLWHVPFENAEKDLPRYDQTINGIKVGPTISDNGVRDCEPGEATAVRDLDSLATSNLAITPSFLPTGAVEGRHEASACRGKFVTHVVEYEIPAEPGVESRLERGEVRWEDVEHGGKITIFRSLSQGAVYRSSNFAAIRWRAGTIQGRPAAIADPILPIGLGRSAIVVWDESEGVRTVLIGVNRRIDELFQVAEGLR